MDNSSPINIVMFILFGISMPIYGIFMVMLWKYRHKSPFNEPFFKLSFNLGVLDLIHLVSSWFLEKFANLAWFRVHLIVMLYPSFFAKLSSLLWWYISVGQTLGVLSLALNRMYVIGLKKTWSTQMLKISLAVIWLLPGIMVGPQLTFDFGYHHFNKSDGVMVSWSEKKWRWHYYFACGIWCFVVALLCALCYTITFIKVRSNDKGETNTNKRKSQIQRKAEINLVWVGLVLCTIQGLYGCLCMAMSWSTNHHNMKMIMMAQNVFHDVYSWVNPYVLFLTSQKVKHHFKAVMICHKLNGVGAVTLQTTKRMKP